MSLSFRPHTAEIWRVQPVLQSSRIVRFDRTSAGTILGQLSQRNGATLNLPLDPIQRGSRAVFLVNLEDAGQLSPGDQLQIRGEIYWIRGEIERYDADQATSHARVQLEKVTSDELGS